LVIADLTFHNANVFYELALRHAQGTPFFHVANAGTKIPFDVSNINTVFIDRSTIGSVDRTREELRRHFEAVRDGGASFDNPVKRHQQKLKADQTGDPIEKRLLAIEEAVAERNRRSNFVINRRAPGISMPRIPVKWPDLAIRQELIESAYHFVFNPGSSESKTLTFLPNGSIGHGQNGNECYWAVVGYAGNLRRAPNAVQSI
jgi:hypothetical protein